MNPNSDRPVILGEVLFDAFPDGSRVLGGAPFNVAWHLQAFGLAPLMITRVGEDAAGRRVRDAMETWGMDTSGLQIDREAATGEVRVHLEDGEPDFEILADRAWDRLDGGTALSALAGNRYSLLYHGSLIARGERSRSALRAIREGTDLPVFMDVNLRDPWWTSERVLGLLTGVRWAKLNRHELLRLQDRSDADGSDLEGLATRSRERLDLEQLIVTNGAEGALVRSRDTTFERRPPAQVEVVDTVGAGDAFSAVWILGLARRWDPETTLRRALEFAAEICHQRGATIDDPALYQRTIDTW
jgi:fructokinase